MRSSMFFGLQIRAVFLDSDCHKVSQIEVSCRRETIHHMLNILHELLADYRSFEAGLCI